MNNDLLSFILQLFPKKDKVRYVFAYKKYEIRDDKTDILERHLDKAQYIKIRFSDREITVNNISKIISLYNFDLDQLIFPFETLYLNLHFCKIKNLLICNGKLFIVRSFIKKSLYKKQTANILFCHYIIKSKIKILISNGNYLIENIFYDY